MKVNELVAQLHSLRCTMDAQQDVLEKIQEAVEENQLHTIDIETIVGNVQSTLGDLDEKMEEAIDTIPFLEDVDLVFEQDMEEIVYLMKYGSPDQQDKGVYVKEHL